MVGLHIDGTWYDVKILKKSLKRQFTIVSGSNAGTAMDYTEIPDIVGTRFDYTVTVYPNPSNRTAYDNLYNYITNPDHGIVTVKFPGITNTQTATFSARVITGTDTLEGNYVKGSGNMRLWESLTLTFRAVAPQRMAT